MNALLLVGDEADALALLQVRRELHPAVLDRYLPEDVRHDVGGPIAMAASTATGIFIISEKDRT